MDSKDQAFLKIHQAGLDKGEVLIQQCKDCGQHVFHPRACCNHCGSEELKWVKAVGRGHVYSISDNASANVIIELEEGPRMSGDIFDLNSDELAVGMKVSVHIVLRQGKAVVAFSSKGHEEAEW